MANSCIDVIPCCQFFKLLPHRAVLLSFSSIETLHLRVAVLLINILAGCWQQGNYAHNDGRTVANITDSACAGNTENTNRRHAGAETSIPQPDNQSGESDEQVPVHGSLSIS